jgi:hypothetical protein
MIIVSQDKNSLVNLKNITQIFITECEEEENSYFIRYENLDGAYEDLGVYVTEERAEGVLEEIAEQYEYIETIKYDRTSLRTKDNFIYRMPEE